MLKRRLLFSYLLIAALQNGFFAQPLYDQNFTNKMQWGLGATSEQGFDFAFEASTGKTFVLGNTDADNDESFSNRIFVLRRNYDGSADASFNTIYIDTPNARDEANGIALQPDGKIVIAGLSDYYPTVWRFNNDGSSDMGFGVGGKKSLTEVGRFRDVVIQSNGKIIAVGNGYIGSPSKAAYLAARFNTNGALDLSFNGTGFIEHRTSTNTYEEDDGAGWGVALQNDGKIVICGYSSSFTGENASAIRLKTNGQIDPAFNNSGSWTSFFSGKDYFYDVKINQNRIYLAGWKRNNNNNYTPMVVALLENGGFDNGFNGFGLEFYDDAANSLDEVYSLAIQSNGDIILAGNKGSKPNLWRVKKDGGLDPTFDFGGTGQPYEIGTIGSHQRVQIHNDCIYTVGSFYPSSASLNSEVFMTRMCLGATPTDEPQAVQNMVLAPNPTDGTATLTVTLTASESAKVKIFDTAGRLLWETALPAGAGEQQIELPVDRVTATGQYLVQVITTRGVTARRLIKT